ncbi:hypothetical protein GWK08_01500 [Leptobacterium flavescens]|uniref:Lipoprotein n=1 Tax=Leptobacterium flavescens TaxID=472055 RepID=A0A6P0UFR8_9FLAO|nr:hypothetical protein [Leptobacterium flavescens]NER12104.1 hypothetical protein [Leptobacterium flavescens]
MRALILIPIFLIFGCKSQWIHHNEKFTKRLDKSARLVQQKDSIIRENYFLKLKLYQDKTNSILTVQYRFDSIMDIQSKFYFKDSILIKYESKGVEALLYKSSRKKEQPYAKLIDQVAYVNQKNKGVLKEREIGLFNYSKLDETYRKLEKVNYATKDLDSLYYHKLIREYTDIIEEHFKK